MTDLEARGMWWSVHPASEGAGRAIWAAFTLRKDVARSLVSRADIPDNTVSLRHCIGMLQKMPEWRAEIERLVEVYPWWEPFVREWAALEADIQLEPQPAESDQWFDRVYRLGVASRAIVDAS